MLEISIDGAQGVLFNIAGGADLSMAEINEAAKIITESISPEAKIIFGTVQDDKLKKGEIKLTVIATGFKNDEIKTTRPTQPSTSLFEDVKPLGSINNGMERQSIQTVKSPTLKEFVDAELEDEDKDFDIPAFIRRKMK